MSFLSENLTLSDLDSESITLLKEIATMLAPIHNGGGTISSNHNQTADNLLTMIDISKMIGQLEKLTSKCFLENMNEV